jgi:hypothetical protein
MINYTDKKLILKIYQLENELGDLIPALADGEEHDISATFVAGLMYVIFDRYLSCIPDANQKGFKDSTIKWLAEMIKDDAGAGYIEKIDPKKFKND